MNTKDLHYFITVCQEGSISKAAQRLFISPQGLSKNIKNLENEVGVSLFIRTSTGIHPTYNGKKFETEAIELVKSIENLKNMFLGQLENQHGVLKIASALGIISSCSLDFFFKFNEKYPNIDVQISEFTDVDVEESILNGLADIGLAVEPVDRSKFHVIPFSSEDECLVVHKSNPLSKKTKISFLDLKEEKIIIESKKFKVYSKFVDYCRIFGFEPNILFESTEIGFAHKLAHLNKGVALSVASAAKDITYEDVIILPFEENFLWEWCVISRINEGLSPVCLEFIKYLGL